MFAPNRLRAAEAGAADGMLPSAPLAMPRMSLSQAQVRAIGSSAHTGSGSPGRLIAKNHSGGKGVSYRSMVVADASYELEKKKERESFRDALKSSTGKRAVEFQRALSNLRSNTLVANDKDASTMVKVIGDKTFYKINGFWVDSSFEKLKKPELKEVEFGSKKYFDLVFGDSEISKYAGAGQQVIFVYKGQCYKIVKSQVKTS